MDLDKLLTCLDSEAELAKQKFEFIYANLIGFFKKQKNLTAPPEEYAVETILRAAGKIADCQSIKNLSAYLFGFAWKILHETWRPPKIRPEAFEKILAGAEPLATDPDEEERSLTRWKKRRLKYMQECLDKRPEDERLLLQDYVTAKMQDTVAALAKSRQTSVAGLRTLIHRIRQELKLCVKARLKSA